MLSAEEEQRINRYAAVMVEGEWSALDPDGLRLPVLPDPPSDRYASWEPAAYMGAAIDDPDTETLVQMLSHGVEIRAFDTVHL